MMRDVRAPAFVAALGLLAAAGCGQKRGAAGLVKSSVLGTYPKETVALLVIEVKKVRKLGADISWVKDLASVAESDGGPLKEIIDRFGRDTMTQVDRISLAVVPTGDDRLAYGALAEGSFGPAKMRAALGGQEILTVVEAGGKLDISLSVLPDGSLALGPRRVLEVMRGNAAARGHGLDANELLLGPLEQVRPEAQFWGSIDCRNLAEIVRRSTEAGDLAGLPLSSRAANSLLSLAFRGTIGGSVEIDLLGLADAEANARTLADSARGIVALGRVGAGSGQAKEWLEFLDGIRIEQSGTDVILRASIPPKTMQSLVGHMVSTQGTSLPAEEGLAGAPAAAVTGQPPEAGPAPGLPAPAAPAPGGADPPNAPAPAPPGP
ncbi:MAG: hypothetical protein HYS34_00180 [Acidobacteria bacterium]|nr:hypothetical protein [Acidobacteriota bacterium]